MTVLRSLVLVALGATAARGVVEITQSNFESEIAGKNAFVKFMAPWCGHCKAMKPAWDQLGDEYAGSNVLIGDVDCTDSGKSLCEDHNIKGYPTVKYIVNGGDPQDYQGAKDFDTLKKFVEETLEVMCDVKTLEKCSNQEKAYIEKMKVKGAEEIKAQKERLNKMKGSSMKADLKKWLGQRLRILTELQGSTTEPEL